ncbi:MAG: hypothetical protein IPH61_14330 [Bacteroidetes bacterium]|nr:hypothetical protein [Bacteroidota bacterium]
MKASKSISYNDYLNPFEHNLHHKLMQFDYVPQTYEASIGNSLDLKVKIKYAGPSKNLLLRKKVENNIELFKLNEVYQQHVDLIREIIYKRNISGDKYMKILKRTFRGLNLSDEEMYKLSYGNFYNEMEFCKRPMAKLTRDIAIGVGSIKTI